jgi:8-oxo-dGTP pyrophosphatase MutT (NUDIX family)
VQPTLDDVRSALAGHHPQAVQGSQSMRQAAVAAVLRSGREGVELLFIHRAEHDRDPWSGHMSFPGGRVEDDDADPLATAVRETSEEVALDLGRRATLIGQLSEVDAIGRGRRVGMVIVPYVFVLDRPCELRPNHEVQEIVWVPLSFLLDRGNRSRLTWTRLGVPVPLPCYRYQGHVIWGLTLIMVDELRRLVSSQSNR